MFRVYTGPVKAGKSKVLIRYTDWCERKVLCFSAKQSQLDGEWVKSRDTTVRQGQIKSIPISSITEVIPYIEAVKDGDLLNECRSVLIDEIQFINVTPDDLRKVINLVDEKGLNLLVFGLDMDYRGLPFKVTATCMAMADSVTKLTGFCDVCGGQHGVMSLRLQDGKPVNIDEEVPLVQLDGEGETEYKVVCRHCYNKETHGLDRKNT